MAISALPELTTRPAVLVVEDDWLVRETIVEHLRDCGYRVAEAATAEEAQAVLEGGANVDFVFSDVVMPGKSGFELAGWIRDHYPKLPVLLTSGYASVARRAADTPYAGRLLEKPYLPGQVVQALEATLHTT